MKFTAPIVQRQKKIEKPISHKMKSICMARHHKGLSDDMLFGDSGELTFKATYSIRDRYMWIATKSIGRLNLFEMDREFPSETFKT